MTRILIFYRTGFFGSNGARYFRERGRRVAVLDNLVRREEIKCV